MQGPMLGPDQGWSGLWYVCVYMHFLNGLRHISTVVGGLCYRLSDYWQLGFPGGEKYSHILSPLFPDLVPQMSLGFHLQPSGFPFTVTSQFLLCCDAGI